MGGAIAPGHNAVNVAALAVKQDATTLLIPITARRQLNHLSDGLAVKISILSYAGMREVLMNALGEERTGLRLRRSVLWRDV